MDNILKAKFFQLKEKFHFNIDVANIHFYQRIKNVVNKSLFFSAASTLSFSFSCLLLNGYVNFSSNLLLSIIFLPLFLSYVNKLNIKYQPQFTKLSSRLPSFLRFFSFIKSAEDSFFFSKDKIITLLADNDFQLVFYDFFNMAKNHIFKIEEQKKYIKNIVLFKSFLEVGNYSQAADYFIDLYGVAHQFEYMVYHNSHNYHDIQLLRTRKKIIDDFLDSVEDNDFNSQNIKSKSIFLSKNVPLQESSSLHQKKIDWKKLMDD